MFAALSRCVVLGCHQHVCRVGMPPAHAVISTSACLIVANNLDLALPPCIYWFFTAKLLDRLSKGIREAPSKAIMNELARDSGDAPDAAYGLRQSLGTAGVSMRTPRCRMQGNGIGQLWEVVCQICQSSTTAA
eukprot:scaffold52427_cov17-Tisochrysis_lutea.AAC.1